MSEKRELALSGGALALPTASENCTPALWRTLKGAPGDNDRRKIEYALLSENALELVEDAKRALPHLEDAIHPCGEEAVLNVLRSLALVFGTPPGRSARHWEAVAPEYIDSLVGMPLEALLKGARDYRDDPESVFFPMPGKLKGKCEPYALELRAAAYRCKLMAEAREVAKRPEPTPEEIARRKAEVAELRASFGVAGLSGGVKKMPTAATAPDRSTADSLRRIEGDLASRKANPIPREPTQESELFD